MLYITVQYNLYHYITCEGFRPQGAHRIYYLQLLLAIYTIYYYYITTATTHDATTLLQLQTCIYIYKICSSNICSILLHRLAQDQQLSRPDLIIQYNLYYCRILLSQHDNHSIQQHMPQQDLLYITTQAGERQIIDSISIIYLARQIVYSIDYSIIYIIV